MEIPTPFDLNQAIQQWRENLGQSPAFHGENLDELESHVRDSVDSLRTSGLSTEEALMVTLKRIGKSNGLEAEFWKLNSSSVWINRALWMLIGIQMWWVASEFSSLMARGCLSVGWSVFKLQLSATSSLGKMALPASICFLIQVSILIAVIAACWVMLNQKGKTVKEWCTVATSRNTTLAICGVGLCLLYVIFHALNFIFFRFLALSFGPEAFAARSVCFSYANMLAILFQIVVITGLTLVIVRKQSASAK